MRRCLLACVIVVSPIFGVIAFQGNSVAAVPEAPGVSCPAFAGTLPTIIAGPGCTDPANTDGIGTFKMSSLSSTTAHMRWHAAHGKTTFSSIVVNTISPNACPIGYTEYEMTGDVSGGTAPADKSIKKGWTLQVFICVSGTTVALLSGTDLEIGAAY